MKIFNKLFLLIFVLMFFACQSEQINDAEKNIDEVKHEYAPDSRVAIFNVSIEKDGGKIILVGETNNLDAKNELLSKMKESEITIQDKITILPSKDLEGKIYGIVNASVCNIRAKAKHASELLTQSLLGHPLRIYKKNEYYYVQTTDNYLGWLNGNELVTMNETEYKDWQDSKKIIFLKETGFSYSKPDVNSTRVSGLIMADLLKYISKKDGFTKVEYPDGRQAYVLSNQCESFDLWKSKTNPTAENILNVAYKFLGEPYLWGGTSAKMLDCSGLSKTAYFMNGIILPRDASQQVFVGETIIENAEEYKKLQPADLLFFGYEKNGRERITHVGIYIGNGKRTCSNK